MLRYGTIAITLILIPGCFVLFPSIYGPTGDLTGSPELKRFESEQELTDYFADQVRARNADMGGGARFEWGGVLSTEDTDAAAGDAGPSGDAGEMQPSPPASPQGGAGAGADGAEEPFSETTIQEAGVDEADVVKTDGTHLYIIHEGVLRIVRVSPRDEFGLISEFELEGYGREMYLHDNKVIALTETHGGFFYFGGMPEPGMVDVAVAESDTASSDGDPTTSEPDPPLADEDPEPDPVDAPPVVDGMPPNGEPRFERPQTIVTIIDVSNPENPAQISRTAFDGTQSSSRMIGGMLHLVLANYQDYFYDVLPRLGEPELDVSGVEVEALLPHYARTAGDTDAASGTVLTWEHMYRPTDPDGFGVVTVISLDATDENAEFSAVGIVAEPGLVYSSLEALYLTDTEWDFSGSTRETTDIYKLAYRDEGVVAVATGSVPGRVLNQYSMGEYDGYLRVATTARTTFGPFGTRSEPGNNVFVLKEVDGTLTVAGQIRDIAPGEEIQSARFMGERGYLVTFEQIDPLFTLNLSDPTAPRVVGELKVPGFSTFIVPMGDDHLLTVGQYIPEDGPFWNQGVQLSIFDISDFADPQLAYNVVIGQGGGGGSEALHNPKAFTYFAEGGLVALPVETYGASPFFDDVVVLEEPDNGQTDPDPDEPTSTEVEPTEPAQASVPEGFQGLMVYRIATDSGFEELGWISTRFEDSWYYWTAFTRGVFIGDDVFAVTNQGVRGAAVEDLASVLYEEDFEAPSPVE